VIAVRYFPELVYRPSENSILKSPESTRSTTRGSKGIGTGYGKDTALKSTTTTFVVDESQDPVTLVIHIATEQELIKGNCTLVFDPSHEIPASQANPFPLASPGVVPPQGYNPYR